MSKKAVCLAAACVVLVTSWLAVVAGTFWILLSGQTANAGLLTLNFHLATPLPDQHPTSLPALLHRDLLQDIQSGASSVLDVAASKASDAAGHVQSAVSSAAASVPQIQDYVPLNCSFGMAQFCVGFKQQLSCSGSPFDLSALVSDQIQDLPGPLEAAIRKRIGELSPLAGGLSNLAADIMGCLIAGSLSLVLLLLLSCCVAYAWPSCIARTTQRAGFKMQMSIHFCAGMICCLPYLALVVVQRKVAAAAEELPAWVDVEEGAVFGVSVGVLVCAMVSAALAAIVARAQRPGSMRGV